MRYSGTTGDSGIQDIKTFSSVIKYLKAKDFHWLKRDMGFFELPEKWDMNSMNDNQKAS